MFTVYKLHQLKAIRLKCLDCCGYHAKEIKLCPATFCPLYPYRQGKLPKNDLELIKLSTAKKLLEEQFNRGNI